MAAEETNVSPVPIIVPLVVVLVLAVVLLYVGHRRKWFALRRKTTISDQIYKDQGRAARYEQVVVTLFRPPDSTVVGVSLADEDELLGRTPNRWSRIGPKPLPRSSTSTRQRHPLVVMLEPDAPAEIAGLQVGDHVVSINGKQCRSQAAATKLFKVLKGEELTVELLRPTFVQTAAVRSLDDAEALKAKRETVERRAAIFGRNLHDVAADDRCQFHALLHALNTQLPTAPAADYDADGLRAALVDVIADEDLLNRPWGESVNAGSLRDVIGAQAARNGWSIEQWAGRMRGAHEWGDGATLIAAAVLFRVRVQVILAEETPNGRAREGDSPPLFTVEVPPSFGANYQPTGDIWIALVSDLHYLSTSAKPTSKAPDSTKGTDGIATETPAEA